jgi:hypothetical protein
MAKRARKGEKKGAKRATANSPNISDVRPASSIQSGAFQRPISLILKNVREFVLLAQSLATSRWLTCSH